MYLTKIFKIIISLYHYFISWWKTTSWIPKFIIIKKNKQIKIKFY